ncbi:hypothetical protein FG05_10578 [Fusarium graminearum]|nr:hypothetical protein FG05_10578 [Fusarium graminearum]
MDAIQPTFDPARDYPKWTADCSTCKAIWYQFTHPDSAPEVSLGFYDEALSTTCPNHKILVQKFIAYIRSKGIDEERYNIGDLGLYKRGGFHREVSLLASISKSGQGWKLLLLNKPDVPKHPGNGRILDPHWADVEAVKGWKHKCLSSHGAKCQNLLKVSSARPAWLLDVQNQCIVSGDECSSYVALSYTYGSYTQPKITSGDFEMLQEPFSLASTTFSAYISPIIRHAMYLTSKIDERYLWADALCVTHHDPEAASEQLATMGTIYANAVVTIIAVDGDSQSGIPGLKGISNPRGIQKEAIPFGDKTILVRNTDINSMGRVGSNYYHNRGWTFQEYSFSSRKIVLLDHELHWMCACTTWHEEVTLYTEIDHIFSYQFDLLTAGFPADFCLTQYAMDYNQRFLTFQEDALPAISGLLSVLSRSFEGGFLYGIPEMFFEHSLGWWGMDMQRRVSSDRPTEKQFAFSGLPSWSWLGWQGYVFYREQTAIRVWSNPIEEAFPITEWYTSNSPSDPPDLRRRIRSTWYEKRDGFKDFAKPMPPGWSRRETSSPRAHPDGCEKYVFQHESFQKWLGKPLEWYYPFPIHEINASTPPSMPDQTQYLFCETFQTTLPCYRGDSPNLILRANICGQSGEMIGRLGLVNKDSWMRFPEEGDGTEAGLQVDLVAICKLKRYTKPKENFVAVDLPQTTEDLYSVLWIEWKDGIAYRLASGEVIAEEWEKLDLKKISLILG